MSLRRAIPDFQLANPIYSGAHVSYYEADEDGEITTTLAALYAAPTGATLAANPQTLDGEGKFSAPVYFADPIIGVVIGPNVESHETGVIAPMSGTWRGDWVTATVYTENDFIRNSVTGNIYVATEDYTSGASVAADVSAGSLELVVDVATIMLGVLAFTGLTDVPVSYSGQGGKGLFVKATADGIEFAAGFRGAASSVDNQVVRFDGTSGGQGQTSPLTISDDGLLSIAEDGDGIAVGATFAQYGNNTSYPKIRLLKGLGTVGSPSYPASGDYLAHFFGANYNSIGGGGLFLKATEAQSAIAGGTQAEIWATSNADTAAEKRATFDDWPNWTDPAGNVHYFPKNIRLSADLSNSSIVGAQVTGLDAVNLPAGTYVFEYWIRYQAAATTTGVKFGVNHSGTAAVFMANMRYASTGGAAATAAATQAAASATGNIHESFSTRTKSTTSPNLGPTVSVDNANSDMLVVVEGLIIVTAAGDLQLWHASEVGAASTVMAGSSLCLRRTA